MAWRTVQKDGALEIYGSLFYHKGQAPYDVAPGTRVWVVDGDQMDRILVWANPRCHDFRGIWGCQTVWDEANLFHRPETVAQTRLRHARETAHAAVDEMRHALDAVETALDADPVVKVDQNPVDAAMQGVEGYFAALQQQQKQEIGRVSFLAVFMAFDASTDAPVRNLRTEAFTFGYPVYQDDITAQETADSFIDEITASYESPVIKRHTQDALAPFRKVGDDWSWDDTDMAQEAAPEQTSGADSR